MRPTRRPRATAATRRVALPLAVVTGLLVASTALAAGFGGRDATEDLMQHSQVSGTVLNEVGAPVAGASLTLGAASATSDPKGRFSLPATEAGWVSAKADGHLPRTLMLEPGLPREVNLTRSTAGTVSLRFGGDVMVGRRFYEPGPGRGPLITSASGPAGHTALLSEIQPLLEDADITVVNLETPLLPDPYYDATGVRPKKYHPTKDLAFGTAPALAQGLSDAGVDAVSLGNNHVLDALDAGIESTLGALDEAGIVHFGAGRNEDEAWAPASIEVRGEEVAFIGCTTVAGESHTIPYVAGPESPGAAWCTPERLRESISLAREGTETVVAMLHGDVEYRRQQTPLMRELAAVAQEAGARTVIGSHPHVVGGLATGKDTLFAETTGNLVFDQVLWSTFPSYLLRVDLRGGSPVQSTTDPLVIDDYRPRPAIGPFADAVSRIAAGTVSGAARLGGPGASVHAGRRGATTSVERSLAAGVPEQLAPGWWVNPATSPGVRFGTDLLYGTGSFEPLSAGGAAGRLWQHGKYARVTSEASCTPEGGASGHGVLLARGPLSTKDVVSYQAHRTQVSSRGALSLLADVRRASEGAALEVRWYSRTEGKSLATSSLPLPEGVWDEHDCAQVRLDLRPPAGARHAEVFVRVTPPLGGQVLRRAAVDNIRLVQWAAKPASGRSHGFIEAEQGATITAHRDPAVGPDEPFIPRAEPIESD